MAKLIKSTGVVKDIFPENGRDFKLTELYKILSCNLIDTLQLSDGKIMIIDDEGKLSGDHEVNMTATLLFREGRMNYNELRQYMISLEESGISVIDARNVKGEDYIAGDVLICSQEEFI